MKQSFLFFAEMLVLSALVLAALALPAPISGRVPLVDGVIGGVHPQDASKVKSLNEDATASTSAPARTPGKLRVVDNSGICGKGFSVFEGNPLLYSQFWQKLRQVFIKLPDMATCLPMRASGSCCTSARLPYDSHERPIDRFWFFAARNNPETAPLITWFNGGVSGADQCSILRCSVN
jgi:hypothetical protein